MKIKTLTAGFLVVVSVFLLAAGNSALASGILVIANKSVPVDNLSSDAVSDIYLGHISRWNNGDSIRVVMLKKGPTHETFVREIVGGTPERLKQHWKKAIFTGTGTPPRVVKTEADMVDFVSSTRGAIGYIGSSVSHGGVKVIPVK
ncbi:MAG: substrate-binding domain-containing protein [Thermodesulfobacteriota bacterium]|nr:substrate-binding domain-containing protein [Thermodesulfobacteriota bacterium]